MRALLLSRRRAFAGEGDQIERFPLQGEMSLFEPNDVGEVVDQARHAVGIRPGWLRPSFRDTRRAAAGAGRWPG